MSHSKLSRAGAFALLGVLSFFFFPLHVQALTASPSPSYDGNYVVSWSTTLGCTYNNDPPFYSYQCNSLYENGVEIASSGYSRSVTGKPAGTYHYQVDYVLYVYGQPYDWGTLEGPVSVTVGTPPARDPLPTQLTYQYETRTGDINWDGKTDIFVRRTSGGVAGNGTLEQVILRQNSSGGTFSILVPNASQAATASSWPTSSASAVVTDFNVDGFVDVEVKGVASAVGVPAAFDQIVFSPAVFFQQQPLGLRAVDASLKQFVGNTLDYFVNPDYYDENATLQYFVGYYWYYYCIPVTDLYGFVEGYYGGEWYCGIYYDYFAGYYFDYTGFSEEAVALWSYEEAYEQGTIGKTASTEGAQEATEEILEVEIGGWPMEEELGANGEHTDPDQRRGLETFWAILGVAQKNAEEIETEEAPKQSPPPAQCVTLNARRVSGLGVTSQHASVVYQPLPVQWISAFDSDPSSTGNGLLVSEPNAESDDPRLTQIVSPVTLPGIPCVAYWAAVVLADQNYDDNLPYHPAPDFAPGAYNSNGYAHGLLNVTGGSATVGTLDRLWGWGKPVPNSAFQ